MSKKFDLIGKTYNQLNVIKQCWFEKEKRTKFLCMCTCGNTIFVKGHELENGKIKSCGCRKLVKSSENAALNTVYHEYKSGAKQRDLEFNLSKEEAFFLFKQNCIYCGEIPKFLAKITWLNKSTGLQLHKALYNGIDRINSSLGYFKENCVTCCFQCNQSKSDYSKDEFLEWIKRVYESNFS